MKTAFEFCVFLIVGFMATAAVAQIPYPNPIDHVVVVDQENRTVDNLFGSNSPSNLFYLPGLVFSTTGQAYTIVNGKKNVFNAGRTYPAGIETWQWGQRRRRRLRSQSQPLGVAKSL